MRRRATVMLAVLGLAVAACGGDGTGPDNGGGQPPRGTFQATVSGDLSINLSGEAVFGIQSGGGTAAFAIALMRGVLGEDNSDVIFIARDNTAPPGVGTFPIRPATCASCTADDFGAGYVRQVGADLGVFVSDTGSFTISAASADTLRGTFEVDVSRLFGSVAANSLTLQGSFTAVAGQVPSP